MFCSNISNDKINFSARCPQIRDADWVVRKVNAFQHTSVTKYRHHIKNFAVKRATLAQDESVHNLRFLIPSNDRNIFFLKIYRSYKHLVEKFSAIRADWKNKSLNFIQTVDEMISQYKKFAMSNCGEDAFLAAVITKLNGVKNVYTACLTKKDGTRLGHQVCIFNKDDSDFDGIIKPFNTIIIDPWFGKADFANLILEEYRMSLKNFINFEDVDKIEFADKYISKICMSGIETFILRTKYPTLSFPYNNREFMHNISKK